jgi:hypothetical protein
LKDTNQLALLACAAAVLTTNLILANPGTTGSAATGFRSTWPEQVERTWIGPEYWSNPLQDWRIRKGRLECIAAGGDRNVFLLTREITDARGSLEMSVRLGRLEDDTAPLKEGFVGFRVGIRGRFKDYRDSAVRGQGLNAGMAWDGRLFIGALQPDAPQVDPLRQNLRLCLKAVPAGDRYGLSLEAFDALDRRLAGIVVSDVQAEHLAGGIALVCSSGKIEPTPAGAAGALDPGFGARRGTERGGTLRFWFRDWEVSGVKSAARDDRAFGPILFALHTLNRKVLKMTAQMAPLQDPGGSVVLETQASSGGAWRQVASAPVDPLSRTATFRVPDWPAESDAPYRLAYSLPRADGLDRVYTYEGAVRKDPVRKPEIVVAAFTGNNDLGFPHADVVRHVAHFKPDLLIFTGDQIYERVGDYGIQRAPVEVAALDYLRKWIIFGWEYGELTKDIPALCLPDDHDVYHGNLWGAGGRHAEGFGSEGQDQGGYTMPAQWVNMVQRTQTSHMPDSADPTPVDQGITVYYCSLLYGGVSFAVIEDRKWKSPPREFLPEAKIVNGWPQDPDYNAAKTGDAAGAQLLGQRQLDFLNAWAADWSGAWIKAAVSQTLFANVATLPRAERNDSNVPRLRVFRPGEYPEDDAPVMDHDSNGWPQTGRNLALRAIRRGLAVHIAGDQHLASTVQYGIDAWNDAGWAICVPSVANIFPRRWFPPKPGSNRRPDAPNYTGEFLDGFGNRITVYAVANPTVSGIEPADLHDRAPGYGIVTFQRATRKIVLANWPRWVEPSEPDARPYPGWPLVIHQYDNGLSGAPWELPLIQTTGVVNPIVQVISQTDGEIVYTVRIQGNSFTPRVFRGGLYTAVVSEPEKNYRVEFKDLPAIQRLP